MNRQLESSVRSTKVSDLDNCSRLYGQRQSADTMLTISTGKTHELKRFNKVVYQIS